MTPPRILVFVDYFLPGFRAGGPIRTIANMIAHLGDTFAFRVVTRDRDLGDEVPYSSVQVDSWNVVGNTEVFYASPANDRLSGLMRLMRQTPHDLVYLNSYFSWRSAGLPLLLRWLGIVPCRPVVLAPRGEFSPGALALKAGKKRLYIRLAGWLGLYRQVCWQASSEQEAEDIRRALGDSALRVMVAPNLLPPLAPVEAGSTAKIPEMVLPSSSALRLVFLSRISPKKNLAFLLQVLAGVDFPISLTIYGPQEDVAYWQQCEALMAALPSHVTVRHAGVLSPEQVPAALAGHELFVFPTLGENFGHVIFEALKAGLPVLLSDQTPWQSTPDGAVQTLPLDALAPWREAIKAQAALSPTERQVRRQAAAALADTMMHSSDRVAANRQLFLEALGG